MLKDKNWRTFAPADVSAGNSPDEAGAEGASAPMAALANSKTKSTFYTAEKVANARRNIEKYDWAKQIRDTAVQRA